VGARYYINENLSFGANYMSLDDLDLISATVRYSF